MSIAREIFSRIRNVQSCESQYVSEIMKNMTDVWTEFIFKDIKKARKLKNEGYDFTLLGQDLYDKGTELDLPTGHYSYCLFVTYKGKCINPLDFKDKLNTALHDELLNDFIYITECPIIYSSMYRQDISANIFISTHMSTTINNMIKLNSIIGDSILYLCVSIPYLRFGSSQPLKLSRYYLSDPDTIDGVSCLNIQFETHMNGLMPDVISCVFVI